MFFFPFTKRKEHYIYARLGKFGGGGEGQGYTNYIYCHHRQEHGEIPILM